MKTVKRIATALLAIAMVLSLVACDQSEKTVVLRGDMTDDMGGIPTTDTWTITAKGDVVQTVNEVFELDLSEYDDETREYLISSFDSLILDPAKEIDGVECSGQMNGDAYIMELAVDCTGDTVKEAVDAGILAIDGGTDLISLKQTQTSLEDQGYEVVE